MRELDKEGRSPRYVAFISLVTLVFLIFIARLFAIQILEASKYEERALQNRIRTNVIKATRGEIYDRDGKLLAKNITGYMLVHYATKQIDSTDVKILREIQSFNMDQIKERLSKEKKSRHEKLLCASLSSDQAYRLPIFDGISPVYKSSSIIYEDKSFYLHFGFDLPSIIRAFFLNVHEKRIVSGASTITMQTSRLLCGGQKRSYTQKIKESFYAFLLELKYSKEELFSIYASLAPFGGNVLGIEGATFRYFSLPQKELTTAQLAMLAVLPNQPSLVTLSKKRERLKEKRDALLRELLKYSFIDNETYLLSVDEMLPDKPHPLPFIAPHYHEMLKRKEESIVAERDNIKEIGTGNLDISRAKVYDGFGKILDFCATGY